MKKLVFVLLYFFIVCAIYSETIVLIQDSNIRAKPTIESSIEFIGKKGEVYLGNLVNDSWYQIGINGKKVFIHKSLVNIVDKNVISKTDNQNNIIIIAIIIIIALIILLNGSKNQCPKCKKLYAKVITDVNIIDEEGFYKNVIREDIHKDKNGNETGRTEREEQVHMIRITKNVICNCKYCGNNWSYIVEKEYEGYELSRT